MVGASNLLGGVIKKHKWNVDNKAANSMLPVSGLMSTYPIANV